MIWEIPNLCRLKKLLKLEDTPSGMCVLERGPSVWLDNLFLVLKVLGASLFDSLNHLRRIQEERGDYPGKICGTVSCLMK